MATLFRNKFALPLGLLLAFLAAVGVWFIPIAPSRPKGSAAASGQASWMQRMSSASTSVASAASPAARWETPKAAGLAEIAPTLSQLRVPPPDSTTLADGSTETPEETPDDGGPEPQPTVQLDWVYQGYIGTAEVRAAMLMIDGRQRFHFEGDTIRDAADPSAEPVKIVSISPVVVVAESRGARVQIPLITLAPEQRAELALDTTTVQPRPVTPAAAADTPTRRPGTAPANDARSEAIERARAANEKGRTTPAQRQPQQRPPARQPATPNPRQRES